METQKITTDSCFNLSVILLGKTLRLHPACSIPLFYSESFLSELSRYIYDAGNVQNHLCLAKNSQRKSPVMIMMIQANG